MKSLQWQLESTMLPRTPSVWKSPPCLAMAPESRVQVVVSHENNPCSEPPTHTFDPTVAIACW